MADDLRARLEAALEPHTHNGHLVDAELGDVVDAVMPVVEERLFRVRNWDGGKCRWCRVIVSETLAAGLHKSVEPHRMNCRLYIGPVAHEPVRTVPNDFWGEITIDCRCGRNYAATAVDGCPNVAETWRGPKSEGAL